MTIAAAILLAGMQATAPAVPAAPSIDGLPLGVLPAQDLPAKGCAAYLFSTGQTRALAVVATADPGSLRLMLDGRVTDLPRTGAEGNATLGLTPAATYAAGGVTATLTLTIEQRATLTAGAAVPIATLRLDRAGQDSIAMPLAGLLGCRT
ncbi:hypothetical protein [Sphingomonas ginsenosidimutans]|jgi:hypothetical protein|uniref:hypothetical protein n=2 Tax=Sphingomonas TaxID=13687 RepID=UPI001D554DDF|nr:hypothetical protein [Sphingomonas ginsenosidimutans]MBY0300846.1 hypothetical protein [Sphingomonas ginsenosidimutans]